MAAVSPEEVAAKKAEAEARRVEVRRHLSLSCFLI